MADPHHMIGVTMGLLEGKLYVSMTVDLVYMFDERYSTHSHHQGFCLFFFFKLWPFPQIFNFLYYFLLLEEAVSYGERPTKQLWE